MPHPQRRCKVQGAVNIFTTLMHCTLGAPCYSYILCCITFCPSMRSAHCAAFQSRQLGKVVVEKLASLAALDSGSYEQQQAGRVRAAGALPGSLRQGQLHRHRHQGVSSCWPSWADSSTGMPQQVRDNTESIQQLQARHQDGGRCDLGAVQLVPIPLRQRACGHPVAWQLSCSETTCLCASEGLNQVQHRDSRTGLYKRNSFTGCSCCSECLAAAACA